MKILCSNILFSQGTYCVRVPLKSFSLDILVILTNIFTISLGCKTKHILQLFTVWHFLETRLTFDLFLRFSFTFKNVNFEFPQNWTLWVLLLRKCLTLTKARSHFLEMPHDEKLQNVFSFYTPMIL